MFDITPLLLNLIVLLLDTVSSFSVLAFISIFSSTFVLVVVCVVVVVIDGLVPGVVLFVTLLVLLETLGFLVILFSVLVY